MVSRHTLRTALLGRDVAVAYGSILALYLLKFVGSQALQVPPYLLIAAYDLVEIALPALTPYHPVGFPLFLYALAVGGAGVTRLVRTSDGDGTTWPETLGGVCVVVAALSLAFGAFVGGPVISPTDNPTPLAVTGATGAVFLVAAWWLLRHPPGRSPDPA